MTSNNIGIAKSSAIAGANPEMILKLKRSRETSPIEQEINMAEQFQKLRKIGTEISQGQYQKNSLSHYEQNRIKSIQSLKYNLQEYSRRDKMPSPKGKISPREKMNQKRNTTFNFDQKSLTSNENKARHSTTIQQTITKLGLTNLDNFPKDINQMRELGIRQEKVIEEQLLKSLSQPHSPTGGFSPTGIYSPQYQFSPRNQYPPPNDTQKIIFTYEEDPKKKSPENIISSTMSKENQDIYNQIANLSKSSQSPKANSQVMSNNNSASGKQVEHPNENVLKKSSVQANQVAQPSQSATTVTNDNKTLDPMPSSLINISIPPVFAVNKNLGKELANSQLTKIQYLLSVKNENNSSPKFNQSINHHQVYNQSHPYYPSNIISNNFFQPRNNRIGFTNPHYQANQISNQISYPAYPFYQSKAINSLNHANLNFNSHTNISTQTLSNLQSHNPMAVTMLNAMQQQNPKMQNPQSLLVPNMQLNQFQGTQESLLQMNYFQNNIQNNFPERKKSDNSDNGGVVLSTTNTSLGYHSDSDDLLSKRLNQPISDHQQTNFSNTKIYDQNNNAQSVIKKFENIKLNESDNNKDNPQQKGTDDPVSAYLNSPIHVQNADKGVEMIWNFDEDNNSFDMKIDLESPTKFFYEKDDGLLDRVEQNKLDDGLFDLYRDKSSEIDLNLFFNT